MENNLNGEDEKKDKKSFLFMNVFFYNIIDYIILRKTWISECEWNNKP
jgi:hypothetical protein